MVEQSTHQDRDITKLSQRSLWEPTIENYLLREVFETSKKNFQFEMDSNKRDNLYQKILQSSHNDIQVTIR
jgi:hypothetical protein